MGKCAIVSAAQKLTATTTVVRQRDGTITIEGGKKAQLSDIEKRRLIESAQSAGAVASAAGGGAVANSSATKPLPIAPDEVAGQLWRFDAVKQIWMEEKHDDDEKASPPALATPNLLPATLRVATFNVWFGELAWEHRTDALADLLLNQDKGGVDTNYDVVCLQEVTPRVIARLSFREDVRKQWRMTDSGRGETIAAGYGVVTMVRATLPAPVITRIMLTTNMGRQALIATFTSRTPPTNAAHHAPPPSTATSTTAIATVHLESLNSAPARTAQLQTIHANLSRHTTALLTGDFNISATGPYGKPAEHAALATAFPMYTDLWVKEHGGDGDDETAAGFGSAVTFDTTINTMNKTLGHSAECSRYDRVMVKDGGGEGFNVRIIGNTPIQPRPKQFTNDIFISDHFGLAFDVSTRVAD